MKKDIFKLLRDNKVGHAKAWFLAHELASLFDASKQALIKSIIDDTDGAHPEYHREIIEGYLQNNQC